MFRPAIIALLLIAPSSAAFAADPVRDSCNTAWNSLSRWDRSTTTYERYIWTCVRNDGITTTMASAPATGICRDGSYTAASNRDSACSRHMGMERWFRASY
jgi:hypothetical protein